MNPSLNSGIEVSNQFGITFLLHNGKLRIVETNNLLVLDALPAPIKNGIDIIALSCDESLLALSSGSNVSIYDTKLFCQQVSNK